MKIPISEIYPAVQAEGSFRTPAVFVRVFGCNLRCNFNGKSCDTPYAVDGSDFSMLTEDKIIKEIKKYNFKHVVFTGGEPMLYQQQIGAIVCKLSDYFLEIETNGTIQPTEYIKKNINQFNISVKLKTSNQCKNYEYKRINKKALKSFDYIKSIFKFVVTSEKDIKEIQQISKLNKNMRICLMPEGQNKKEILKKLPMVLDLCLKYKYEFSNRDHILAFGKKRGK